MEPLNYFRSALQYFTRRDYLALNERFDGDNMRVKSQLAEGKNAPKFILPVNGLIFNTELKGLPQNPKLPYPAIVLEFLELRDEQPIKKVVLAHQSDAGYIDVGLFCGIDDIWISAPFNARIHTVPDNDLPCVAFHYPPEVLARHKENIVEDLYAMARPDIRAVLELIEALSCSNVNIDNVPPRKLNKSSLKRGAAPFDEYKILSVKGRSDHKNTGAAIGSRMQPREHLRRGHIRRHATAGNIWVNSMAVNAGIGGKIHKDYAL